MAVRHGLKTGFPVLAVIALVVAGCGGGKKDTASNAASKSHRYVIEAPPQSGAPSGIYVTLIAPVPFPVKLLTRKGARIVPRAKGRQACSATKVVHGGHGPTAALNGKKVTVKINGSGPLLSVICTVVKKGTFDLPKLAGP